MFIGRTDVEAETPILWPPDVKNWLTGKDPDAGTILSWTIKKTTPKNWCFWPVVLEKTLESPLDSKAIQPVNPKENQSWIFIGRTDAEALAPWCEELTHLKRPWYSERLKAGGEGDDRGWDGWMASPTQWTWVWVSSQSWWWTRKPGMLQSMGVTKSQTQLSDWTELNTLRN